MARLPWDALVSFDVELFELLHGTLLVSVIMRATNP
jgi:hypothetical protein